MKRTKPFIKEHWLDNLKFFLDNYNYDNETIVCELEAEITKKYKRKYAIAVNSATNAIFMALYIWSLKYPKRYKVLIPNWGYPAAFKACLMLGLEPVAIDVDERGLTVDSVIDNLDFKTLAVIHIENNGIIGDPQPIKKILANTGTLFIEDAAPSMLQTHAGTFGEISIFSFSPTKPLAGGEGGVILLDNPNLWNDLLVLRHTPDYNNRQPSLNCRLSPFIAAYIKPQLPYLDYISKMREMVHMHYAHRLDIFSEYTNKHGAIMYISEKAEQISQALSRFGVEHRYRHYPCYNQDAELFPISCKVRDTIIDLPIHHELEEKQIAYICNIIIRAEGE